MGELALTDNVPQEQPEASGRGADCWGTCEELLLVSAVRRHGTSNWNLIASELKDRAISLSVCPVYFSEEACKQKYDSLRGRYGSSTSTSRDDDTGNNMHWFEELRKLRVAHLKRELELYDGSIGSLQVKIKRLKAEKAQDMLLSKQAGITVAKAQSNDSLLVTMSHEIHVSSSPSDEGSVMDDVVHSSKTPSSLPLEKPMVPENGEVDEQGPNLLPAPSPEQVTCEDQQVHDSAEEVKGTSPIVADMTVGVDDSSQQSGEIHNLEVETTEQPSVLGTSTDESKPGAELHNVANSVPQEGENTFVPSIAELDSKQKDGLLDEMVEPAVGGHEAVRTEFLSADEDTEMLQSEDVQQDLDAEVLPQGSSGNDMILAEVEGTSLPAASELDSVRDKDADDELLAALELDSVRDKDADDELLAASEQIDVPDAEAVPSSPPCLSVTTVKLEDVGTTQPEAVMLDDSGEKLTDGRHHENLSNEQDKMGDPPCIVLSGTESVDEFPEATSSNGGLKSQENVELDLDVAQEGPEKQSDTVVLCDGGHLEVADEHSVDVGVGSEETLAEIHLIPEQCADLTHEIVHHVEEVGTCQSKHVSTLTVEEDLVHGNLAIPDVAKEVVDLDMRDDEVAEKLADVHSDDAMSPSDLKLVPIEASMDTEVDGFKEGTVINGDKNEELGNNSFVYPPHSVMLGLAADGPDVQIIIALDEPNDVLTNIKSKTILTSGDVGGESVNQLSTSTQSKLTDGVEDVAISRDGPEPVEKVEADLGSTSIIAVSPEILPGDKSLHLKAGSTESNPTPSQPNAMELLKMVYGSVHDMPPESSILPEEVAAEPPVASVSPVPPPVLVPDPSNILPEVPAQENTLLEVAMETCNEQPKVSELDGEAEKSRHSQESASLAGEVEETQETVSTENRDDHSDVEKFQPEAVDLSGASSDPHVLSPPVKEPSQEETVQRSATDQSVEDVAHGQEEIGQLQSQSLQFSAGDEVGNTEQEKEIIQMTADTKLETSKDDLLEVPVIEPLALVKVNAESNEDVGSPDIPVNEPDWTEATTKVGIEGGHDSLRSTPITVKIVDMEKKPEETDSSQERKDSKEKVYVPVKTVEHRPGSPVESIIGDLESKGISTSHEGSDSVHEQYKHGSDEYGEEEEGRQGTHDYGESQVDKSEAGSPGDGNDDLSSLSRRNRRDSKISRKLFPLLECLQNICSDKKAKIFKGRPEIQNHRYDLLIRRHMDLTTVRGRLEEGVYSSSREFFRDLLLIFNNALVYYPSESSEFSAAKALRAEATREMERIFRMEALLNQDGPATGTRESKKPKSGEGGAVPIVSGSPALVGGSVTGVLATAVGRSLDKASRKRSGSRAPIAVETSCSETLVDSEAAGARSGSANVVNAPSSGRAGEAAESQEDEEVNGRFKDTKSLHKGGSGRGKVPREELLEGILSKNASNKGLGRVKLRGMKVDDSKKSGVPYKAIGSKIKEEREDTEKKKGKERDEIGDNDLLRKGKSLTKLKDRDVMREREGESKAVPTRKAPSAPRPPSNSHDTVSQTVARPARGVRKPVNSTKEPARVPEQQPKKRARK